MTPTQISPDMFDGTYRVPDLDGIRGRVKLVGPIVTRYLVIDDGKVTVTPEPGPADCTITAFEPLDQMRVVSGELNLVTSLLQGRIEADGDEMLVVKIAGSMPDIGRQKARAMKSQERS